MSNIQRPTSLLSPNAHFAPNLFFLAPKEIPPSSFVAHLSFALSLVGLLVLLTAIPFSPFSSGTRGRLHPLSSEHPKPLVDLRIYRCPAQSSVVSNKLKLCK
jgi:hypothetical protein